MSVQSAPTGIAQAIAAAGLASGEKASPQAISPKYPALSEESRTHVDTDCASYHSGFAVSTLLTWASRGNGVLTPIRRGRRLGWSVAELRKLNGLGVQQ